MLRLKRDLEQLRKVVRAQASDVSLPSLENYTLRPATRAELEALRAKYDNARRDVLAIQAIRDDDSEEDARKRVHAAADLEIEMLQAAATYRNRLRAAGHEAAEDERGESALIERLDRAETSASLAGGEPPAPAPAEREPRARSRGPTTMARQDSKTAGRGQAATRIDYGPIEASTPTVPSTTATEPTELDRDRLMRQIADVLERAQRYSSLAALQRVEEESADRATLANIERLIAAYDAKRQEILSMPPVSEATTLLGLKNRARKLQKLDLELRNIFMEHRNERERLRVRAKEAPPATKRSSLAPVAIVGVRARGLPGVRANSRISTSALNRIMRKRWNERHDHVAACEDAEITFLDADGDYYGPIVVPLGDHGSLPEFIGSRVRALRSGGLRGQQTSSKRADELADALDAMSFDLADDDDDAPKAPTRPQDAAEDVQDAPGDRVRTRRPGHAQAGSPGRPTDAGSHGAQARRVAPPGEGSYARGEEAPAVGASRSEVMPRLNPAKRARVCAMTAGGLGRDARRELPQWGFGLPSERRYPLVVLRDGQVVLSHKHASNAKGRALQQLRAGKLSLEEYEEIAKRASSVLAWCGCGHRAKEIERSLR